MHIKDLVEALIPEEAEEFAEFVWGKDFKKIILSGESTVKLWNEKYGDKLKLSLDGSPASDIPDMIMIWRKIRDEKFASKKSLK